VSLLPLTPRIVAVRSPRSSAVLALVVGLIAAYLLLAISNLRGLERPSAGFVYEQQLDGQLEANPVTLEASRATEALGEVTIATVNGRAVTYERVGSAVVTSLLDTSPHARNRFGLRTRGGEVVEVELGVAQPRLTTLAQRAPERVLYPFVGLLYLVLGLWAWWKRPGDRAATSMLLFTLVACTNMQLNLELDPIAQAIGVVQRFIFPLYGPALINFGIRFTGYHQNRWLERVTAGALLAAIAIGAALVQFPGRTASGFEWGQLAAGTLLFASVSLCVGLGVSVARSHSPLALRRRGRLLAKTNLVAFFIPSSTVILPGWPGDWVVVISLLTTFPIAMAYAMVRHGVFNFRIVLRQGLLYALLSVGALLAYVGLVLLVLTFADEAPHATTLGASFVAVVVVLLSLLQLRIQGSINRFVFRSRYLFSDAIAQASAKLASAKSRAAMTEAVATALLGKLRLSRAALAIYRGDKTMECISLGPAAAPGTDEGGSYDEVVPLPAHLVPNLIAPVRRALDTQHIVTAYDSAAASAQIAQPERLSASGTVSARSDEGTFWSRFGLEAVVPLAVGTEANGSRVVGCLLLGPRRDGKPLDSADEHLIFTLANQLSVAVENTAAFEEIRSLKDGLEQQVLERTQDLSRALSELKRAQVQLIESEKQAMLGRLVAGMAHEINTPLGTLRSSVDTLGRLLGGYQRYVETQSSQGDAEAKRLERTGAAADGLLAVMNDSAERLIRLMDSLKRFVSLDQSSHQRLDVRDSIDSALAVLGPSLTPGVTIRQNYVDSDLRIKGDPAKLNQLFWNLLQNSLTALQGKGEIRIDARRDQGQITVDLSDNGVGIPEERLHDVFDFGFTQKNGRVGLRLGLPTSKLTVDELGGEISIQSVPGEGTSVHLRLPG
jgi:two-component system, NtrC family, sensor kinase